MSGNLLAINTKGHKKWSPSPTLDIQEDLEEDEEASDFSTSPSIPDENIDFSLVYTLHTFEATVEGQASVKKEDSLTLLDDSNSYWWLIKNLKTLEIGYIPAENIETPYERLARLNKYRNLEITTEPGHYINKNKINKKKVVLSKSIHFQLQVILTGEEEEETVYETWTSELSETDHEESDSDLDDSSSEQTLTEEETFPSRVLRVYAGNLNVGADYHSIRVSENISADELLSKTLEKFHIPQIDVHHQKHSVEYYLALKNREGEEITLRTEDRPYGIYQTLNAHLTTPMPRLSEQFKNSLKPKKKHEVQFLLHKRIKRRGEGGIVHVKLSLLAQMNDSSYSFHSWLTKKRKKVVLEPERIDKLVAVDGALTISQLTKVACDKFHIVAHPSHKYRLLLNTKTRDVLLNNHLILSDILKGLNHDEEKQFILHNFNSTQVVLSNPRKVFPETTNQPIQVAVTVDRATQIILKRVDAALSEHLEQEPVADGKFTMSVSRNDQGGIDIYLPHGLIRSYQIQQETQYSLMTSGSGASLIQSILPEENGHSVSQKELETLIQYGSHYLDSLETKYHLNTVN